MDSLPDEILLQICEIVSTQYWKLTGYRTDTLHRTRNLHRLSLASRRFNRIVTPLLYEHITCPRNLHTPFWRYIVDTTRQNADLAQLIKSFSMARQDPSESPGSSLVNIRSEWPTFLLESLISYEGFARKEALLDLERRSKSGDFIKMTFLILQTSTVNKMRLGDFIERLNYHPHTRLPLIIEEMGLRIYKDIDAGVVPQCFVYLRHLHIDLESWGYFPAEAIIPLLHLPRLRTLGLENWGFLTRRRRRAKFIVFGSGRTWPVRSSSVEELILTSAYVTSKQFSSLVSSCTALRRFEYTPYWHGELAKHAKTILSLGSHAESLESVTIRAPRNFSMLRFAIFRNIPQLVSLKHLELPYIVCEDGQPPGNIVHYLPPSLEELMVVIRPGWVLALTQDGMESVILETSKAIGDAIMKGYLPCLKAVEIQFLWEQPYTAMIDDIILPRPDIRNMISTLKGSNVNFGLSLFGFWHRLVRSPSIEEMRILKNAFLGISVWCKTHKILRLSTSPEPCVRGTDNSRYRQSPYDPALDPWDFENDSMKEGP